MADDALSADTPTEVIATPPAADCAAPRVVTVAKLTPILLRIEESLGSKVSTTGQSFGLALAESLIAEGETLVPAGTTGQGEVIHAKKAGFAGSGGELVMAATYLEFEGRRIALRSLAIARTGKSNIGLAGAVGASTLGPIAFLISGHNTEIEAGTLAQAKLAADTEFMLPPMAGTTLCLKKENRE